MKRMEKLLHLNKKPYEIQIWFKNALNIYNIGYALLASFRETATVEYYFY